MPIYEFRCAECKRRFSVLVGVGQGDESSTCPHCGSTKTDKLVSRFLHGKSEDDRVDALADRLEQYGEPDSGRGARQMMREMGKAMDEDMADDMEEMFESDMEGGLDDE